MNLRDDFVGTYATTAWKPGSSLPGGLFQVHQPLQVTADGDFGCLLAWNDAGGQAHSLTLRWTPLFGGALLGTLVEVKGAGILLVEAGAELDALQRQLTATLVTGEITGDPGTIAAQAGLPPVVGSE
jgi:hypothetical protein